jgi:hypothetical protein
MRKRASEFDFPDHVLFYSRIIPPLFENNISDILCRLVLLLVKTGTATENKKPETSNRWALTE